MTIFLSVLLIVALLAYMIFSIILQNKSNQLKKKLHTQLTKLNEYLSNQELKASNTVPTRNAFK